MWYSSRWPLMIIVMCCFSAWVSAQQNHNDNVKIQAVERGVSVKTFGSVFGYLDQPLGTVVRVTGIAIDGDSTRLKIDAGKTLLRIDKVNGVRLTESAIFREYYASEGVRLPLKGELFDFYVHESGEFGGVVSIPTNLGIDPGPVVAHNGFGYHPKLRIYKSTARS